MGGLGGIAYSTTVNSGGTEGVSSGGSATGTTLNRGGTIDVTYLPYVSAGSASVNPTTDLLTVTVGGQTYTQLLSGDYTNAPLLLAPDDGGGTDVIEGGLWPTDPLVVTLGNGGDWSAPDDNGDSTYTGTVYIGLDDGENVLEVQGATVDREEDELAFSSGAVSTSLIGGIPTPILQGPFDLTYADATAVPQEAQSPYLSQLPVTVTQVQVAADAVGIDYAMPLPGPFNSITVPDSAPDGSFALEITNNGYQLGGSQGSIDLPSVTDAKFFNLFTASFTQGSISVTPSGSAVLIRGQIVTATPVSSNGSTTTTLDVAGSTNFISISDIAGTFQYGASFAFTADNWVMPGGWTLENISGAINTQADTISIAASLDIPLTRAIDVGLAGSFNFSYNPWRLNDIGLGVTEIGGGIPIPDTPLWLNSVAGTLENLSAGAGGPITLDGTLGFDVGPSAANFQLGVLTITGSYVAGQSFTAGVTGQFGVFGNTALGTLSGSETFDWANGSASGNVSLSLLANVFEGSMNFNESQSAFTFAGSGSLTIPNSVTVFGATYSVPWILAGKTLAVSLSGGDVFSGPSAGGYLSAAGTLNLGLGITVTAGLNITLPNASSNGSVTFYGGLMPISASPTPACIPRPAA